MRRVVHIIRSETLGRRLATAKSVAKSLAESLTKSLAETLSEGLALEPPHIRSDNRGFTIHSSLDLSYLYLVSRLAEFDDAGLDGREESAVAE